MPSAQARHKSLIPETLEHPSCPSLVACPLSLEPQTSILCLGHSGLHVCPPAQLRLVWLSTLKDPPLGDDGIRSQRL